MNQLTSIPAFGYESISVHAGTVHQAQDRAERDRLIGKIQAAAAENPALNEYANNLQTNLEKNIPTEKRLWKLENLRKGLGYIPLAGFGMGISRFVRVSKFPEGYTKNKAAHVVRGIFELLGLGILLAIPDLIATAVKAKQMKNKQLS